MDFEPIYLELSGSMFTGKGIVLNAEVAS